MHGIVYQYNLSFDGGKDVQEEALANVMTNGLMAVFVDNPWLLPWMQKEIKSDSD